MIEDYDDNCAVCGTSQSSASNLASEAFLLNNDPKCGHRFCQRCIDNQLNRKRSFACPSCHTVVSKEKLSSKSLDDCEVEKDFKVRRRIKSIYNLTEDDFPNLLEFQNYEEEVEDIVFCIVHGEQHERESAEARVREYQKQHVSDITKRQSDLGEAIKLREERISLEDIEAKTRAAQFQESLERERREKAEYTRQLNELLMGERDQITAPDPRKSRNITTSKDTALSSSPLVTSSSSQQQAVVHPVLVLLNSRALPRPISTSTSQQSQNQEQVHSATDIPQTSGVVQQTQKATVQQLYSAGGYDPNEYTRRNWRELVSSIAVSQYCRGNMHVRKKFKDAYKGNSNTNVESGGEWMDQVHSDDRLLWLSKAAETTAFGTHLPLYWK